MSSKPNENNHFWRSTPARNFGYYANQLRLDFFHIYDQPDEFLGWTAIQYRVSVKRLPGRIREWFR